MDKIETVRGPISPDEMGITLPHEHLLISTLSWWMEPAEASKKPLVNAPVTMDKLGILRRDPFISMDNLKLYDVDVAVEELKTFRRMGGSTLVDLTLPGIGRDPLALRGISVDTGINILVSTGFYIQKTHPPIVKKKSVDELCEIMVQELTWGIGNTGIKAGVIGEIGCSYPIHPDERKVMKAAACAQKRTGVPFTVHPPLRDVENKRVVKMADKILDLVQKNGVNLEKFYMSHMDLSCEDIDYHKSIMDKYEGVILEYDTFGNEIYVDSMYPGAGNPSDRERVGAIVELCEQGYEKQLLLSQDICLKISLTKYGGYGYAHILKHIIPEIETKGVTKKQINIMLVENPKRLFTPSKV